MTRLSWMHMFPLVLLTLVEYLLYWPEWISEGIFLKTSCLKENNEEFTRVGAIVFPWRVARSFKRYWFFHSVLYCSEGEYSITLIFRSMGSTIWHRFPLKFWINRNSSFKWCTRYLRALAQSKYYKYSYRNFRSEGRYKNRGLYHSRGHFSNVRDLYIRDFLFRWRPKSEVEGECIPSMWNIFIFDI